MLNTRHRLVNFGLMLCLATSTATLAMMQAVPPAAHAAISWTAAPPAGSGIAPWESGTSVGAGSVSLSVDNATGNLFLQTRGQSIPGVNGFAQVFAPHYQTFARSFQTDVGYGWSTGTGRDVGLLLSTSSATFYDGSGRGWVFPKSGSTFSTPAGADAQLVQNADGTYSLTSNASGGKINFDSGGYVTSFQNRQGNSISPIYGSNGWLMEIRNTEGQLSLVSLDASGRVAAFSDPGGTGGGGRTTYYTYDSNGNLATVKDPAGNITTLTYDSTHLLTQVTDPRGDQTQVFYTTLNGNPAVARIVRITNTSTNTGPTTTFSYTTGSTQITDPNNHSTTIAYDSSNRPATVTNADGTSSSMVWNADNHSTQTTDENQHTTTYSYDSNNNLTQVTLSNGLHSTAQYTDATHPYEPTSVTDPQGHTSTIQYNSQGLPTTVTDALGHSSTVAYNSNGTVASSTDANGHTTTYGYTSVGLPNLVTPPSPLGQFSCTYSSVNDYISSATDGKGQSTGYSYDTAGRLASYAFGAGLTVSYTYDPNSNLTQMVDPTGTTTYTYNNVDQQTQKALPGGQSITYSYDNAGNLLTKTDSAGTTSYSYDNTDQLTSLTDPYTNRTTFGYDPAGNQTQTSYPNGVTEQMSYNSAGELTRIWATNSSGTALTSYTYSYTNPANNQATTLPYSETDVSGNVTSNSYDALNRLTQAIQTNSTGATINNWAYGFDNVGNLISKTTNGTTTAMSYNAANEQTQSGSITKSYDANGSLTGTSAGMNVAYNSANQTTSITPSGGTPVSMTYTNVGQAQRVSAGATSYQYDATGMNSASTGVTSTHVSNGPGGVLSENVSGGSFFYLHDGHGSVVALTNSGGSVVNSYAYSPAGAATAATEQVTNPFRWNQRVWDGASSLYHDRSGYYDPTAQMHTQVVKSDSVETSASMSNMQQDALLQVYHLHHKTGRFSEQPFKMFKGSTKVQVSATYANYGNGLVQVTVSASSSAYLIEGGTFEVTYTNSTTGQSGVYDSGMVYNQGYGGINGASIDTSPNTMTWTSPTIDVGVGSVGLDVRAQYDLTQIGDDFETDIVLLGASLST